MGEFMRFGGILDMSTIDYPGKVSSVVFLHGCNFRCPFCHNKLLVEGDEYQEAEIYKIIESIKKHSGFIDAVVITGGEPTLQKELEELCRGLKGIKLLVKLDTNGYEPEIVEKLLKNGLLDFISMDIKSAPEKYNKLSGISCNLDKIKKTLEIIKKSGVDYELRTTIIPGINDTEEDIKSVIDFIKPARTYVLQQFKQENGTLSDEFANIQKTDRDLLLKLAKIVKNNGLNVKIRTEEAGEEEL